MAVSYNPAQQAAANAGASAAAIKKVATPKKKTPVVNNAAQAAASAAGVTPVQLAQVASQSAEQLSTSVVPTVPNIPVPRVPVVTAPVNQALEDDANLVFQRGYPSSTAPTSQPSLSALATNAAPSAPGNPDFTSLNPAQIAAMNAGQPQQVVDSLAGASPGQTGKPLQQAQMNAEKTHTGEGLPFISYNAAQIAAMNAGQPQQVVDSLAGASTEQIKSLEGDSDALKSLEAFRNQQTAPVASGGGGGGYSGTASASSNMPNVTVPTAPGTGATSVSGEGTATGGTSGSVVAPTAPPDMSNAYLVQLNNMAFDYDPAQDRDYLRAVAQTENSIIQSMIGRGGMYSSVAQSAVAVKLADLSIEYENMAYDKYVDERSFMFERAQFEQSRLNTMWEQNFQVAQFDATLQQRKFENEMAIAEFNFTLEKEAYNRKRQAAADARAAASLAYSKQQAILKQQQQDKQNSIANALLANQLDVKKFDEMTNQWSQGNGKASAEVAEYFSAYGVYQGASINNSAMQKVVEQKERYLNNQAYEISEIAVDLGQAAIAVEYMDTYNQPAETVIRGTTEANSDVTMFRNYQDILNRATDINTSSGYSAVIGKLTDPSYYDTAVNGLGEYYYSKILNDLQQAKIGQASSGD